MIDQNRHKQYLLLLSRKFSTTPIIVTTMMPSTKPRASHVSTRRTQDIAIVNTEGSVLGPALQQSVSPTETLVPSSRHRLGLASRFYPRLPRSRIKIKGQGSPDGVSMSYAPTPRERLARYFLLTYPTKISNVLFAQKKTRRYKH
jgi:hypothetical protein